MKYFNTAGPCEPNRHYMLAAEERLPDAWRIIERGQYFVLHAPRQSGKTTELAALARRLMTEGHYLALRFSCESAEALGDDYVRAEQLVLGRIHHAAIVQNLAPELLPPDPWPEAAPGTQLTVGLSAWAERCTRPIVLFFDEIDALRGESLRSVLRQLRDGYTGNRDGFVHSVGLCGLRDVRDYKPAPECFCPGAASGGDPTRLGSASPFNIKVKSLRLADFTAIEVAELYAQHTTDTGQEFTAEALAQAFHYTQGQPWLVNALAAEIIDEMRVEPPITITVEHVDTAKERLIQTRATHLDSLISKLHEPRVQRVMEPLVAGLLPEVDPIFDDDVSYTRDLGLIAPSNPIAVANPIYREVIVRVLGSGIESTIAAEPRSFRLPDGQIDFPRLLTEFTAFWKEHGEFLAGSAGYREAAPQLIMMAYLHRIINGGGYIDREYGVGRGRIDLLIRQPYTDPTGVRAWQREAVEIKVWRNNTTDPLMTGLQQLDDYLDRLSLHTGILAIFNTRDDAAPITERTEITQAQTLSGRTITLLRG